MQLSAVPPSKTWAECSQSLYGHFPRMKKAMKEDKVGLWGSALLAAPSSWDRDKLSQQSSRTAY